MQQENNMPFLPNAQRSLVSKVNNVAGGAIGKIKNPLLRGAAGQLLEGVFPGLAGGTPDFTDSVFRDAFNNQVEQVVNTATDQAATIQVRTTRANNGALAENYDWRARLRPKNGGIDRFYSQLGANGDHLLRPLEESNGIVWQYTPTIFMSGSAEYSEAMMQGMNYPINTFISSRPPDIPITADFSANDIYEARYLLAVMSFLKICTKAAFGDDAVARGTAGTPPPVLVFEYLADHGFNKVPVVITNWTMELPSDVDYVPVIVGQTTTYVPTAANIMINLKPQYTPHKIRRRFSVEAVTSGVAYKDGFI
jgi:hypothetical protein